MNDTYSIMYSPEAMDDLRETYSYIAFVLRTTSTAESQINRIRKEIQSLDFMPSRYMLVDWEPWQSMGMHKVPIDNFVIYYMVDDGKHIVNIVRIFYAGRDVKAIINAELD